MSWHSETRGNKSGFPVIFSRLWWPIEPKFSQVCYFTYISCDTWSVGLGQYCLPKVYNGFNKVALTSSEQAHSNLLQEKPRETSWILRWKVGVSDYYEMKLPLVWWLKGLCTLCTCRTYTKVLCFVKTQSMSTDLHQTCTV